MNEGRRVQRVLWGRSARLVGAALAGGACAVAVIAGAVGVNSRPESPGVDRLRDSSAAQVQPAALASRLRYIGRDGLTGMPAPIDDRFIAEHEEAIELYGEVERDPVPPPPATGVDIATIRVAAIEVSANLGRYGVDSFGRLDVPQDRVTVGWNPAYSSLPGEGGSTFFAAHYEFGGLPGVFNRLSTLQPGTEVEVTLTDGSVAVYRVVSTVDYPLGSIDMGALLKGLEGRESIVLMTCSGPPNEGEYPLRTVVLAERVDS